MKRKDIIYVAIQLILFTAYAFSPGKQIVAIPNVVRYAALGIAILGIIILLLALLQLNKNLSPFPTPKQGAQLVTNGLYHWVRHPIYSGIILFSYAYAIYSFSWLRLLIACLLWLLFNLKSSYEEKLLSEKFYTYTDYQKNTPRFFPFL